MQIREYNENMEAKNLSEFACLSKNSRGRARDEIQCNMRTVFQRDRDRIIYSKSFRRLKHKTQVFISPEGDHYRTRLTHTLEVSQIARAIARSLRLNEDLTEAIALGHDLGHTPFGHAGERVLDKISSMGFKHNEQGVRVVEVLEKERKGLNLTWEVKDGILCHTGKNMPSTLEGCVVRFADKIAYINHDIEDAIRAGILTENDLPQDCTRVLGKTSSLRINNMITNIVENSINKNTICMSSEFQDSSCKLRNYMFENVYVGSNAKTEESKAELMLQELFLYILNNSSLLPQDYYQVIEKDGLERTALDYVAGMTDRYAVEKFKSIYIPISW